MAWKGIGKVYYNYWKNVEKLKYNYYVHTTDYFVKIIIKSHFGWKMLQISVAWIFFQSFQDNFNIWSYYLNLNQHKEIKIHNGKQKPIFVEKIIKKYLLFNKKLKKNYNNKKKHVVVFKFKENSTNFQ